MKRVLLVALAAAVAALALGLFFGAVTNSPPSEWLAPQESTGRPPRLVALLAVGPIILVALAVVAVRLYRAARAKRAKRKN